MSDLRIDAMADAKAMQEAYDTGDKEALVELVKKYTALAALRAIEARQQ